MPTRAHITSSIKVRDAPAVLKASADFNPLNPLTTLADIHLGIQEFADGRVSSLVENGPITKPVSVLNE